MTITAIARGVGNFVRKYPIATVAALGGVGLVTYAAVTKTKKQAVDTMNYMALSNPLLNLLGWMTHAFNPTNTETGLLDSPFAKYVVDKNIKNYEEYYNNLSSSEKVAEFYKNGGKGVTFEKQA